MNLKITSSQHGHLEVLKTIFAGTKCYPWNGDLIISKGAEHLSTHNSQTPPTLSFSQFFKRENRIPRSLVVSIPRTLIQLSLVKDVIALTTRNKIDCLTQIGISLFHSFASILWLNIRHQIPFHPICPLCQYIYRLIPATRYLLVSFALFPRTVEARKFRFVECREITSVIEEV